jgi:hypothetical protein
MTDEQIKQNAEEYADALYDRKYQNELWRENYGAHIAGAHSRDEEVKRLYNSLEHFRSIINNLRNPWISVKDRLPEEEVNNISIPVAAITNEGYWFKGQYDYDNKEWFFSEDPDHLDFEAGEFVTYWMPIPELKKK